MVSIKYRVLTVSFALVLIGSVLAAEPSSTATVKLPSQVGNSWENRTAPDDDDVTSKDEKTTTTTTRIRTTTERDLGSQSHSPSHNQSHVSHERYTDTDMKMSHAAHEMTSMAHATLNECPVGFKRDPSGKCRQIFPSTYL